MPDRRAVMGWPCLLVPGFSVKEERVDERVSELVRHPRRADSPGRLTTTCVTAAFDMVLECQTWGLCSRLLLLVVYLYFIID